MSNDMTSLTLVLDEKELKYLKNVFVEKLNWTLKEVSYSMPI